jgi:hypothetical protein
MQMLKLREALVEEGRRLRVLMEEEVAVAKVELIRLREDRVGSSRFSNIQIVFGFMDLPVMWVGCLQATDQEQLHYLQQLSDDFGNYIKVRPILKRKGFYTQAMHFPWAYVLWIFSPMEMKNVQGAHHTTNVRAAFAAQCVDVPGLDTEYQERYPSDWQ